MRRATLKYILVSWVILAFAGQSLAAMSVPCPMASSGMGAMDHSAHKMPMEASDSITSECCGDEFCPMMSCSAAAVISSTTLYSAPEVLADAVDSYQFFYPSLENSSLYRPPISP